MKKALALAASLLTTPVVASDKCDIVTQDHRWSIFTITQVADTANHKYCISFFTADPRVKDIEIQALNAGKSTFGKQACIDIKATDSQEIVPFIYPSDGTTALPLPPLGYDQALASYNALSQGCIAGQIRPMSNDETLNIPKRGFASRIYVTDWHL